ncbi:hypothetical protein [uncultured Shewanella sp.]|uniref:hypothetical protein n=1 Tax=uncultured Shewanella sp. TaxID=173975 RepID=UPI00262EF518|nr:hypothetical protein [uncultured Shewanella sp.]
MNAGIQLSLLIGPMVALPAPLLITEAIQSVSVSLMDRGKSTFQLSLNADREGVMTPDYPLLMTDLLKTNNRVIISVMINAIPTVLIDGFITNVEFNYTNGSGSGTLSITGEDLLSRMDLKEEFFEFPSMTVDEIVLSRVEKYAEYGVLPELEPVVIPVWEPEERTRIQNGTDLSVIEYYANLAGFVYRVRPTVPMENTFYFGLPTSFHTEGAPLNVNMGPSTNVDDINLTYDATLPQTVSGMLEEDGTEDEPVPVEILEAIRPVPMAVEDPILTNDPYVRNVLYTDPTNGAIAGEELAQQSVNRSTDKVLSGQITVDTIRYGFVIDPPCVVCIRGAGFSFDGNYYVSGVQHSISEGKYKQQLTVQREGLGSTVVTAMENLV